MVFLALSGRLRDVRPAIGPLWAHLSRQPTTRQVEVGQRQRREGTVGILDQPPIAHLGKAPQSLDYRKHMFDLRPHFLLGAVLCPPDFVGRLVLAAAYPFVGEVFCLWRLGANLRYLSLIGVVAIHPFFVPMQ
jgi:hypothetical protein